MMMWLVAARVTFYHQFLERLAAQVYSIPHYTELHIMSVSANVHNVIPTRTSLITPGISPIGGRNDVWRRALRP